MGLLNELAEKLWKIKPKGEIELITPYSGHSY
jgi:hypothetical protein